METTETGASTAQPSAAVVADLDSDSAEPKISADGHTSASFGSVDEASRGGPHAHADGFVPLGAAIRPRSAIPRVLLALCVIAVMLVVGILPRMHQHAKLEAAAQSRHESGVIVDVVRPQFEGATTRLVLPGSVQAIAETTIYARTNGYLRRRYVDFGSHVKAGQVLADIEAPELDQELIRARAQESQSTAGQAQAEADVARLVAAISQATAELAKTRSNLGGARADLAHSNAKELEAEGARAEAVARLDAIRRKYVGVVAGLARAKARLALADKTYKRWQILEKAGAVSGQELDETQADFEQNQAAVDSARADVDSAKADVDAAQQAVQSREADVRAAKADVNAAEQKVGAAQSGVQSARASVEAARANARAGSANVMASKANVGASQANVNSYASMRGFEQVTAPFDGVITARNVDVGALITAGSGATATADPTSTVPHTGLFGIARTDVVRIQTQVPESAVGAIHKGLRAGIHVQEFPAHTFDGEVFDTAGALDASSRTLLTELRVDNADNRLIPGMYAQVEFVLHQPTRLVRIPANTLVIDATGTRVATVTDKNTVHFVTVTIGRDYGKEVDITGGLTGDEMLIRNPTDELTEGAPVHVAKPSAP